MFSFIKNYRTQLMMGVRQDLDGAVDAFDTTDDNALDSAEYQKLLESAEARNIVKLAEVDSLEAGLEFASNLPAEIDPSESNELHEKTLMFLVTKVLKIKGERICDGSIDGKIGRNSKTDIQTLVPSYDKGVITKEVIDAIKKAAADTITTEREAQEAARVAQEKVEEDARTLLDSYADYDAIQALTKDEKKAVQEALKTLGHDVGAVDGITGPKTEAGYTSYTEARDTAAAAARVAATSAAIPAAEAALRTARQRDESTDVAAARTQAELEEDKEALEEAVRLAEQAQADLDVGIQYRIEAFREKVRANSIGNEAEAAVVEATQRAILAQEALDRAAALEGTEQEEFQASRDARVAAQEALTAAQEAATLSQRELQQAVLSEGELERDLEAARAALSEARRNRELLKTELDHFNRNHGPDLESLRSMYPNFQPDLSMSIQDAYDGVFNTTHLSPRDEELAGLQLHIILEKSITESSRAANVEYIEAKQIFDTIEADLNEAREDVTEKEDADRLADIAVVDRGGALEAAKEGVAEAARELANAIRAVKDASREDTIADANWAARQEEYANAAKELAAAEAELQVAENNVDRLIEIDAALDGAVDVAEAAVMASEERLIGVSGEQGAADRALTQAEADLDAAKQADLDAYIAELTNDGKNTELVAMIEADPDGMRAMIEGLRAMTPSMVANLGNALGYFDVSTAHIGVGEVTGALVIDLVTFAKSQNIPVEKATPRYITQMSNAFQAKADEIGEEMRQRGKWLDDRKNAYEDYFNTTVGYPDLEYVQTVEIDGQSSPAQIVSNIPNGLRGRPRCLTVTNSHTTDTYMTTNTHRVTQDHRGKETISSRHSSERDYVGSDTTVSSSTQRWFEMSQDGQTREEIAGLLGSGDAYLRPSYRMLSRIYEPSVVNGQVVLETQDWYEANQTGWDEATEMERINTDVNISSKFLGSAVAEVKREAPDRYAEIQGEVRSHLMQQDEFSFLVWEAETGERAEAKQLIGRKTTLPSGKETWTLVMFDTTSGTELQRENFATGDAMLNSQMGELAIERSTYRYFGVTDSSTEDGLRGVDDQGLVRCGDHEKIVLLDEPMPELPQGYNFLRNGLPCGVLGAFCQHKTTHSGNIRELEQDEWKYTKLPQPGGDDDDDRGGADTSTPGVRGGGDVGGGGPGGTGVTR